MGTLLLQMGERSIKVRNQNTPSQLTSDQVMRFYRLWLGLLSHANEEQRLVPSIIGRDFHEGIKTENAGKIAAYIWKHPQIFESFVKKSPLTKPEKLIIDTWRKNHIKGKFYIVKYLRNGAVFLSLDKTEKPYLVKGLASNFEEIWPKQTLPFLVETVLLPFEDSITTCGLYYGSNVMFGRNVTQDIREVSQQAELTYGLITSLPHTHIATKQDAEIGQIKFYLSSLKNFEIYQAELDELVKKDSKIYFPVYNYYRGLLTAKLYKKECKKLGLKKIHFAVFSSVVVAVHLQKQEVEKIVKQILSSDSLDQVVFDKV